MARISIALGLIILLTTAAGRSLAQTTNYPKEIRGYKVERAAVELKKDEDNKSETEQLLSFGELQLVAITPLGISLAAPIVVSPVKQKGEVDFLVFEDIVVNGTSVQIDEYHRSFALPNKKNTTLQDPLRFFIYLPSAVLAALGEWSNSKDTWIMTGRIYVFGSFKKSLFGFKRCIPVDLNLTMRNPLKN
jgi:hypothetical protein